MVKKLSLLLLIIFTFSLISCNDTASNINSTENPNFEAYLYSVDPNTGETHKNSSLKFTGKYSIEDCLKEIAINTSANSFDNLPITFTKIETIDNKSIAIIDLKEKEENKDASPENIKGSNWLYSFFQGSTGGYVTSTILTENFLQKNYTGEWIDGVQFTYNGKPLSAQHVEELQTIIYK